MSDSASIPIRVMLVAAAAILLAACKGFAVIPAQPTNTAVPTTPVPVTGVDPTQALLVTPDAGRVQEPVFACRRKT